LIKKTITINFYQIKGKNDEIYNDVEKNQSVENLNDENSRNDEVNNANANKIESQKNQLRNDKFLEVNP